jgi:hypothetical protein
MERVNQMANATENKSTTDTPKRGRQKDTYTNADARFKGVVTKRVRTALNVLASCEAPSRNLAPSADEEKGYFFTPEQVEKIVSAIRAQADHLEESYRAALESPGQKVVKGGFTL